MSGSHASSASSGLPILVVDDDPAQRSLLESFLSGQGFAIRSACSAERALDLLSQEPVGMMISDVRMPGMSGLEALRRVRERHGELPVLLVTAYADVRDAVGAMRDGALNYLEKPIDLDELLSSVRQAMGAVETDEAAIPEGFQLRPGVISNSPSIRQVFRECALVAPSETRVMITGESGVGKEVVADQIHAWSPRAGGPFIKVNCAAIPQDLLESELFGHERGAFTGATTARVGRFEDADGGTILLDEVAEMSPALQAKLLRVTQDGTFQRVGSNEERRSDARILAATNRNLEQEVSAGRFREDLFFRLNVFEVYVPPLRERKADILPLAMHFAAHFSGGKTRMSPSAETCLQLYDWPGNVRELENAMQRAALLSRGGLILDEHLPKRVQEAGLEATGTTEGTTTPKPMEEIERVLILKTLREKNFNRSETARTLGISRRALLYKLRRFADEGHAIDPDEE